MAFSSESSFSDEEIYSSREDYNFETYSLIWLDASIDSEENLDAQEQIRSSINYLQTFDELDECKDYIHSVSCDDRIVLIASGHFGEQLVPSIHCLRQISSIYIYCLNKEYHQEWSQQYRKIKGVHNELCELINQIQCEHSGRRRRFNSVDEPLSILVSNGKTTDEKSTTKLNGQFVQFQLLIYCLLKMEHNLTDKDEFVNRCRKIYKKNTKEIKTIYEFDERYTPEHSIWWYTQETFIYRLLNKALRIQNIDFLFLFRFFIRDIENELSQLQYQSSVRVYRGQLMSKEELNLLKNSENQFISSNSFLSTTLNYKVALIYLDPSSTDNLLERILFEIDADPNQTGIKPFADVSTVSEFGEEDEILMMLGSIFYIKNISFGIDHIWHIQMNLCSDHDFELQKIVFHMRNQYSLRNTRLLLFANVLIDMANFDDAEKYLSRLLKQLPNDHRDIPKCYHALGKVLCEKGNYDLSLEYFDKALEYLKNFKSNQSQSAYIYNNIGEVYQNKNEYNKALISYKKSLEIFRETFTDNDENLAWCYNNIGIIYERQKKYSKSQDYLLKALNIKEKVLPALHPCLSNTYNNLANVYYYLKQYDQALEKYQLSYQIFKNSLTPRHPSIARTLKNIGIIYEAKKDFIQAKGIYEEVLQFRQSILSSTHPDLIQTKNDIQRVSSKIQ